MNRYTDMAKVLEPKQIGVARLEKYEIPEFYRYIYNTPNQEYVRLWVDGEMMMSNTNMEKRTSLDFVRHAEGDVLICGLGIGLVLLPLFESEKVKSITVVEKYQDVIDCVLPQIKPYDKENKLTVICKDCFEFYTKDRFDTIFIDIWANINRDIYEEEMKPLKNKYKRYLKPDKRSMSNVFVWAEYNARYEVRLL